MLNIWWRSREKSELLFLKATFAGLTHEGNGKTPDFKQMQSIALYTVLCYAKGCRVDQALSCFPPPCWDLDEILSLVNNRSVKR